MKSRSFIDSNILVYTDDAAWPDKQRLATNLLESDWQTGNLIFSTQVLQEYYAAATRKLGVPLETAQRKIELLGSQEIIIVNHEDILRAIDLQRLHQFFFWDALIIRAAQRAACQVLFSEDMQHGRKIGDIEIRNPFLDLV